MNPLVLTIAGSDSSGAAGVAADLRTFAAYGVHGACVVTAVTAQSLSEYFAAQPVSASMIEAQLAAVGRLPPAAAVKIGMLGTAQAVHAVAAALRARPAFTVLDPVLASTSGGSLATAQTVTAILTELLPHVALLTPNTVEAAHLTGLPVETSDDLPKAAAALRALGARAVLIKGGHLISPADTQVHDYYEDEHRSFWLTSVRAPARARGTGCTLASAVAAGVARGLEPTDAVVVARLYLGGRLASATQLAAEAPAVLSAGGWPPRGELPWLTPTLAAARARPRFPDCGPAPLGFYPIVATAAWVRRLVDLGVTTLQLRAKDLPAAELEREVKEAIAAARRTGARLFINDHWQLALKHGAYGVHLGQEDLETADLAAIAHAGLRLGLSTHSYAEAARAHALQPSYVALGPIFETTCKSMRFGPQGMAKLRDWRAALPYPLVAIGGLRLEHAETARAAGADGIAVISDVVQAAEPEARVKAWLAALEGPAH